MTAVALVRHSPLNLIDCFSLVIGNGTAPPWSSVLALPIVSDRDNWDNRDSSTESRCQCGFSLSQFVVRMPFLAGTGRDKLPARRCPSFGAGAGVCTHPRTHFYSMDPLKIWRKGVRGTPSHGNRA